MRRLNGWTCLAVGAIVTTFAIPNLHAKSPPLEYFAVELGPIVAKFNKQHIVSDAPLSQNVWYQMDSNPRVVTESGSEAYLEIPENGNDAYTGYRIVGVKPEGEAVDGQFFVLRRHPDTPRESVLARFDFRAEEAGADHAAFMRAKGEYFRRLWSEQMAGSAMFRHLAVKSLAEVGETAVSRGPNWPIGRRGGADETIQLMSGGRAVSENLQLDRQLPTTATDEAELKSLAAVEGISIPEFDWSTRIKQQQIELDSLSSLIPHDQYAVFLPSFQALQQTVDQGNQLSRPFVQWVEPQSRATDVLGFYQRQLGLPLNGLTRQVGAALIGEVALTGSDPYFRTGTDVAVLMQTTQPMLLYQSIQAQIASQVALWKNAERVEHKTENHSFIEWSTADRHLSSFVAAADETVIVSNSLHQMMRILDCADGTRTAMHDLEEYQFFRQRYPRDTKDESAFIVITDAAIRRWCGPQWRISASRRTRARATIAEVTMQHADDLVLGKVNGSTRIHAAGNVPDAGELTLASRGVRSDRYGTLNFQVPIAEMNLQHATDAEIKLYEDWRDRYQRRWRRVFDPIAIQLSLRQNVVAADVSVIPLILGTQYATWTELVGNSRLRAGVSDGHDDAMLSMAIALDPNCRMLQTVRRVLGGNSNVNLLGWIDDSIIAYLEHDEQWEAKLAQRSPWQLSSVDVLHGLPVGFFLPSKENLRMAAFVVATRAMIERFSPNLIRWDVASHRDLDYVVGTVVKGTPIGKADDLPKICYVTTPRGFTISFNENVIKRVIDRHLDDDSHPADAAEPTEQGKQITVRFTGEGASMLAKSDSRSGIRRMSRLSWSNLPIRNHFRSRYPDKDPAKVYEQLFGQSLVDPGGGNYQWSDPFATFESSLYGHHLAPQPGPPVTPALSPRDSIETTLSFQDGGLRATLEVTKRE